MKLNFEKNLPHQNRAVESVISLFEGLDIKKQENSYKNYVNPEFIINQKYEQNIAKVQEKNSITQKATNSNIIDIMMETGTGKTYTYTKTIFELNRNYGIFKFVVIVPTLSIKAGTINFLKSDSVREHFKEQYQKVIKLHIVESQKKSKAQKSKFPQAVSSFVNSGSYEKDTIQVMIINAGMINSETMQKNYDKTLFDKYSIPFNAIASTKPFFIIDEPHKFAKVNKTWANIQKMNPQFIIRYGATFLEYENLVYTLSAVDAFNRNLVKGVIGHITEFETGKNVYVRFVSSNGKEASFELYQNNEKKIYKLGKKESLQKIHPAMHDLFIEKLNKTEVILSNGLVLKKGDKINPYSYAQTLQEIMIQKAIKNHFEIEKQLLTREVKIKPLTLFFIDNIEEYRSQNGYIRKKIEECIKAEVENLLNNNEITQNSFYKNYLENTLKNLSLTHAGYFSKDNTGKDELIEKEINEILHDKQALLDLANPRRFIFSKWTLREGWDNPNVFQICKLRSSGSEISKLQEVGRGLRLPVNEYGNRVKTEQFYLNYFVDFTESDFVDRLVNEINEKSNAIPRNIEPEKLSENMINKICEVYGLDEEELLEKLDADNVITRTNKFKENGFEYIKRNFPLIFTGVNTNKVRKSSHIPKKIKIRVEKYTELKELWEKLNEKVVLEYKFDNENEFKRFFVNFLKEQNNNFKIDGLQEKTKKIEIENNLAQVSEEQSIYNKLIPVATMKYGKFLKELSRQLNINLKTLHQAFVEAKIDINKYLNLATIRIIKQKFNDYLMLNAFDKFTIEYRKVSNTVHPTKFTSKNGSVLTEVLASDIGLFYSNEKVADSYLFDSLFYDSELEKENITTEIKEVIVFTKIPKNSIKIPVAGGKTYSPDFAYVLEYNNGEKKLNFVVETKDIDDYSLRREENKKIQHAKEFFEGKIDIKFLTQFKNKKIKELLYELLDKKLSFTD